MRSTVIGILLLCIAGCASPVPSSCECSEGKLGVVVVRPGEDSAAVFHACSISCKWSKKEFKLCIPLLKH